MTHFPHGAFVAIHAAEEQRRKDEEEELLMTKYTADELDGDWEFKIVRSEAGVFRKPEVFASLMQEESLAGWEMVEKLDNRRVRFKRKRDARRRDATLPPGIDPYRTQYGGGSAARVIILLTVAFLLAGGIGAAVLTEVGAIPDASWVLLSVVGVMVLVVMIALIALGRTRK